MNGINALQNSSREIPSPFHHVRTQQEGSSYEPGRGPSPDSNHAGTSRTVSNNFLLFISHPVCGIIAA